MPLLQTRRTSGGKSLKLSDEWYGVAKLSDFKAGKQTHAVILANNQAIVIYNVDGKLYCSDAQSPA